MWGVEGTKDTGRTEEMLFLVVRRYQGPIRVEMAGVEDVSLVHGVLSSKQRVTICHYFFNLHSVSEDFHFVSVQVSQVMGQIWL